MMCLIACRADPDQRLLPDNWCLREQLTPERDPEVHRVLRLMLEDPAPGLVGRARC